MPVVVAPAALAGIALANRSGTSTPAGAATAELADISQACTSWVNDDAPWGPTSAGWCQEMTGWVGQQVTSGSMMGSTMWADPDRMLSTCQAWMEANPSNDRP